MNNLKEFVTTDVLFAVVVGIAAAITTGAHDVSVIDRGANGLDDARGCGTAGGSGTPGG